MGLARIVFLMSFISQKEKQALISSFIDHLATSDLIEHEAYRSWFEWENIQGYSTADHSGFFTVFHGQRQVCLIAVLKYSYIKIMGIAGVQEGAEYNHFNHFRLFAQSCSQFFI
jgi:hypothetical protein